MLIRVIYEEQENIIEARRVIEKSSGFTIIQLSLDDMITVDVPNSRNREKLKKELFDTGKLDLRKYDAHRN